MGWNVESIKVEEKVISNPKLYLKRAEHYIMLQDYGQALKECNAYLESGGDKQIYNSLYDDIDALIHGKNIICSATEKKILNIIGKVMGIKLTENPYNNLFAECRKRGADSLDVFQVFMEVEEEFNIEVPNDIIEQMETWTLRNIGYYIDSKRK